LKLADYFPVGDAEQFRPGAYRVSVKFYDAGLNMPAPVDSGPVRFELAPGRREGTREQREGASGRGEDAVQQDLKGLEGTWHMVASE
jgi:hypothetical protein